MAEKQTSLQDLFLNSLRRSKTPVTMFLVKGVKLQGIVTWFDNFSVLLRRDGQSQLIYKHAISTIMLIQLGHEDIHSDPVVVDTDALPAPVTLAAIEKACVAISSDPEVLGALDLFWGWVKGLAPTRHENYASIESALKRLSLSDVDMVA